MTWVFLLSFLTVHVVNHIAARFTHTKSDIALAFADRLIFLKSPSQK